MCEWMVAVHSFSLSLPASLSPSLSLDLPLCLSHPLSPSPTLLTQSYVIEVSISNSQELHGTNEWSQSRKFANIGICIAKCKLKRGEGLGVFSSSSLWEMDVRTCVLLDYVRVQTGATHLTTVSFNYTSNPKLQSSLKMREGCMKLQTAYKVDS